MTAPAKARRTRKPTGIPPWPTILLAGGEKSGKSWSAAQFSGSDLVGQTYYIEIGEHYADEYGRIPGARYEIVEHDGTYGDILESVRWAVAQERVDGKPTCIILDSATILWDLLVDQAHATAYRRWRNKNPKAPEPDDEVQVTIDLWNIAKAKFAAVIGELYRHDGPSILTARLEQVAVMANGKPTTEKAWKVRAEKNLPFEVDAVIQAREPRTFQITGLRSTELELPVGKTIPMPGFTVEGFLRKLGLDKAGATAPRSVTPLQTADPVQVAAKTAEAEPPVEDPLITDDQRKALHARLREKKGELSRDQKLAGFSAFCKREVTTSTDIRFSEWRGLMSMLDGLPRFVAPAPGPVPLSIRQTEDEATIAAAQSLVPHAQAAIQEQVEDSLLDGIQSAPDPTALNAAWSRAEAAQQRGEIGSADLSALRDAYTLREDWLREQYDAAQQRARTAVAA
jgi:hypothetical protein